MSAELRLELSLLTSAGETPQDSENHHDTKGVREPPDGHAHQAHGEVEHE